MFENDKPNWELFCKHYRFRYYIGVNFITTIAFAEKFWSRSFDSVRPHAWEVDIFTQELIHNCMIPAKEILCAVDDPHGEPGTALLERSEDKFNRIAAEIAQIQ